MTSDDKRWADLTALERVLEVYGSNEERWPAAERARLGAVIQTDRKATAMLAQVRALDRVLAYAPRPSAASEQALADRIVQAAVADTARRAAPAGSNVIAWPERGRAAVPARTPVRAAWPAAALLAASLVAGVFVGFSGQATPAMQAVAGAVGLEAGEDAVNLAFIDDAGVYSDEDML
jgi:anti-sigma factor RsiW